DAAHDVPPDPDVAEHAGVRYISRPMAVVREPGAVAIHRRREILPPDDAKRISVDVIRLDDIGPEELEREAVAAGFVPEPPRRIRATEVYVGSTVVVLRV